MTASHEQSCRIRVTSHFAAVLLLLLFVLNCSGLGDWCKRHWCNFSKFRKMEASPLPLLPQITGVTYKHTHTHTHTHTRTQVNTYTYTQIHNLEGAFFVYIFHRQMFVDCSKVHSSYS